jgi:hypothetical protein
LGVNYRTPTEIMEVAADVMRAADPRFEPPESVRSTGVAPWARETNDVPDAVADAVAEEVDAGGHVAVIAPPRLLPALAAALKDAETGVAPDLTRPLVLLGPRQAKGLEFDSVIVVEPAEFTTSDLYVALTRATQRLGVVYTDKLPPGLADHFADSAVTAV